MDLLLEERPSLYVSPQMMEGRSCWHLQLDDWSFDSVFPTEEVLVALWHGVAPKAGKLVCFRVYHGHAVFTVPKGVMTNEVYQKFVATVKDYIKPKEHAHA
jgi:hypothetical protein